MAVINPPSMQSGRTVTAPVPTYKARIVLTTLTMPTVNPASGTGTTPPPTTGQIYPRGVK